MGEAGVVVIIGLIVVAVILFYIAVEQGNTIARYERKLLEQADKLAKKGKK